MSPTVANPFKGHLPQGDPRGPLYAAGGCTWPTVPAFRYWLTSNDATGDLAFLEHNPIRISCIVELTSHNGGRWQLLGPHASVDAVLAAKNFTPGESSYRWSFLIVVTAIPLDPLFFYVQRNVETCNRTIPLPDLWTDSSGDHRTGETFRMEQIEWNKTAPPPMM